METIIKRIAWAALLICAACSSDDITIETPSDDTTTVHDELSYVTLQAFSEDLDSKVYVSDGNLTPYWSDSDVIAIFDDEKRVFTVKECNGSNAVFEGSLSNTYSGSLYAAYPYDAVSSRSGETVTLLLPSSQKVSYGVSVDKDALLAVAATDSGTNLSFLNVTGLVRFQIDSEDIVSIKLEGNGSEPLAGSVTASFRTGVISSGGSSSSVTLSSSSGGALAAGVYFMAVAPVSLSSGLTLTFTNGSGKVATKTSSNSAEIKRSSGINLGLVTEGLNWGDAEEEEEEDTGGGIIESDDVDANDDDIVSNTTFDCTVRVVFSNTGDAVVKNASDLSVSIDGNDVTITNDTKKSIIYELSGSTSDGFFKLYSAKKQAIVLNGVSITNPSGAAINNQSKKRTFVVVKGTNSLKDGATYTETPADEDEKAAFFSEGQLVFSGSGSLSITASGKAGISSDDYVRFMSSPTVKVTSSSGNGVRGKDYIQVSNGSIEATVSASTKKGFTSDSLVVFDGGTTTISVAGASAYDSDDAEFKNAAGVKADKQVQINGGTLTVTCTGNGAKGISSDEAVKITGGTTSVTMSGGVVYDSISAEYKGTAGIKADSYFNMSAGSLTIKNSGKGGKGIRAGDYDYDSISHSVSDSFITGGTISITTTGTETNDVSCKAIKIGWVSKSGTGDHATVTGNAGNITVSGGSIVLNCSGAECFEAKGNLTVNNGQIYASSSADDAINSQGEMNFNGGYVYAFSSKNDAIDANHDLILTGGYVTAITTKGSPEVALDANTESRYKLYINSGATLVAYGGLESGYSASQTVKTMSCTAGNWNALYGGGAYLCAFKVPSGISSVAVSAPALSSGYKGVTVSGTSYCNNVWAKSGISGGSQVTLSNYSGGGSHR
ncbi:MAG: carbohydrate-binding domain-containing protein [Bacteroidales bacterium]|nr:carbohydrate-binding domain-containing protein [Bacteroidales bacterium]